MSLRTRESKKPVRQPNENFVSIESRFTSNCADMLNDIDNTVHIVEPPAGSITFVCCNSTMGFMGIAVHPSWAPLGAKRFLDMVSGGFFSSKVGMFRALKGFLVQFGLAGDPKVQRIWNEQGSLKDDRPWLPQGPVGREIKGVKRYKRGYIAYAGAGNHSRGTQLIIAFQDNGPLGGGCPWEIPFGQLVGKQSYESLDKIYTGYGEKPSQGKIQNRGLAYLETEFPLLDYITRCEIAQENVPWQYAIK